jgi:hypothetical protein
MGSIFAIRSARAREGGLSPHPHPSWVICSTPRRDSAQRWLQPIDGLSSVGGRTTDCPTTWWGGQSTSFNETRISSFSGTRSGWQRNEFQADAGSPDSLLCRYSLTEKLDFFSTNQKCSRFLSHFWIFPSLLIRRYSWIA